MTKFSKADNGEILTAGTDLKNWLQDKKTQRLDDKEGVSA
jgi:hypothetical protein